MHAAPPRQIRVVTLARYMYAPPYTYDWSGEEGGVSCEGVVPGTPCEDLLHREPATGRYRGTSLIRNTRNPSIATGPEA